MRLQVQLYIDTSGDPTSEQPTYERVDLNDFESIELTSSVQEVRDIEKVFTDYSRQFTLPASAQNNSVFKHYYNTNIVNGFDARIKQRAYISLNGILFREGFIRLSEVTRKNERPSMYKVVFFGAMVSLKQVLGDLKLAALSGLSKFNHEYSRTVVNNGFVTGLGLQGETMVTSVNRDVVYPAISALDRWFYDSDDVSPPEPLVFAQGSSRNIFNSSDNGDYGIDYLHLKPAIKVIHIIEAIESRFSSIKFSRDFFGRPFFDKLYLLLHNTKGLLSPSNSLQDDISLTFDIGTNSSNSDFEYVSGEPDQRPMVTSWSSSAIGSFEVISVIKYEVIASVTVLSPSTGSNYKIKILDNQFIIAESGSLSGDSSLTATLCTENVTPHENIKVVVESADPTDLTTFDLDLELRRVEYTLFFDDLDSIEDPCSPPSSTPITTFSSFYGLSNSVNTLSTIEIVQHMPDITILSFIQGLFKAFNLTSEVNSEGEIVVKTLNTFYEDGQDIDITDYIITDEDTLSRVELFDNIKFEYSEPKTFGMLRQNEVLQDDFGNLEFQLSPNGTERNLAFDGKKYEVKLPFEKLFFDRLRDENDLNTPIDFGNGWLADSNQSPTITKPVIFFNEPTTASGDEEFGFLDVGRFTQYNRPSNTTVDGNFSLNFGEEIDEYSGQPVTRSLFRLFYQDYISNLYDISNRMFTVKAYLPLSFLISYNMNDKMVIRDKYYTINMIKTNLTTGYSQLELIPEFTPFVPDSGSDITPPTVPTNLASGIRTNTSIDFNWTESTDNVAVTGYKVYVDGSLEQTLGVTTQSSLTGLDINTSYSIEVSAFDAAGNESAKSTAVSMSTTNLPDTVAPSIPLNVLVTAVSSSTVTLSWNPSFDNVGVTGYKVYVNGTSPISVGNVTSYQVTGLTQLTTYAFNITAFDAAGNESQFSQTVLETTTLPIIT